MRAPVPDPRFEPVRVLVTNHAGVMAERRIMPVQIRFGARPPWHPDPQWLLQAFDPDKGARGEYRDFALAGLHAFGAPAVGTAQLARSSVQLAALLLDAVTAASEQLAQIPRLDRRAMAALEILADAEAAAQP